jgi:hypothetical protein
MPITPLSKGAADYLRSFDLRAVCQSAGGRIWISDNPSGAVAAYWSRASDAGRVAEAAWHLGDIMAAGHRCGVALTPHQIVLKRTAERMAALDQEIAGYRCRHAEEFQRDISRAATGGQAMRPAVHVLLGSTAEIARGCCRLGSAQGNPGDVLRCVRRNPGPSPGRIASERVSNH